MNLDKQPHCKQLWPPELKLALCSALLRLRLHLTARLLAGY